MEHLKVLVSTNQTHPEKQPFFFFNSVIRYLHWMYVMVSNCGGGRNTYYTYTFHASQKAS